MTNIASSSSIILLLLSLSFFTSCNSEDAKQSGRKILTDQAKQQILTVLEVNESLHAAFFEYDADKVEEYAGEVMAALSLIKNEQLNNVLKSSTRLLSQIKAENDREMNNVNYHKVSLEFISVLKNFDLGLIYNAYSCPMVKKSWVQNSQKKKRVHNPYDPTMPHCGSQDTRF